jgi:hypothetical protein
MGYLWYSDGTHVYNSLNQCIALTPETSSMFEEEDKDEGLPLEPNHPLILSIDERILWLSRQISVCSDQINRYMNLENVTGNYDGKWNTLKKYGITKPLSILSVRVTQREDYQKELKELVELKDSWLYPN